MLFRTDVTVLLLVRAIGTLPVAVTYEALVNAPTSVATREKDGLVTVI